MIGRGVVFTPERLNQIRNLIERGTSREKIAETIGCSVGSLQVTCSRHGISLRRARLNSGIKPPAKPKEPAPEPSEPWNNLPTFSVRMNYRGRHVDFPIGLTAENVTTLAMLAGVADKRSTEMLAEIIATALENKLNDRRAPALSRSMAMHHARSFLRSV